MKAEVAYVLLKMKHEVRFEEPITGDMKHGPRSDLYDVTVNVHYEVGKLTNSAKNHYKGVDVVHIPYGANIKEYIVPDKYIEKRKDIYAQKLMDKKRLWLLRKRQEIRENLKKRDRNQPL